MTNLQLPQVPDTLPWSDNLFDPVGLKLSLTPLDDLGFPYDKRGANLTVPADVKERRAFAREVGRSVEKTILGIVNLSEQDE